MGSRRSATARRAFTRWWTRLPVHGSRSTPRIACIAKPVTSRIRRRTSPGSRRKAAAVPTIRTCRRRMRRVLPLMVLLLAGCAGTPTAPSQPKPDADSTAFSTYLSARFAAGEHDLPQAARYYGRALSNNPSDPSLLALSFFYSTTSGDFEAAGKYAQSVVTASPDDRAARLALAVIGFKHKDYAEVRKQLSLSAKGPFTTLTTSLFDAWAAAAMHDAPGMQKDLVALNQQSGAENLAAFHTALLQDFLGDTAAADAAYKKALGSGAPTPRTLEAYGRFLERNGRGKDAAKLYHAHENEGGLVSVAHPGLMRIAAGQK